MSSATEAARAKVGTVLRDRWHLDSLLGVGGMAWVYAATHRNKNRVAIKLLAPHLSHSPDIQRRFLREGYAANSIEHPGAVKVFDDDVSEDGLAFLVMELLEGKTLAQLRREAGGRMDPKRVLDYSARVLDVLAAAHDHSVVHRDIKPSNVFVTADDTIKVVDFGIARVAEAEAGDDEATQTGMLLGSAPFMPPEQARGRWELVDPRTDIWSMGATMFQLLSGRAVHEASTPQERLMSAMTERARSLGSVVPSMPPSVVELVDRSLNFEREARWQTAREMRDRTLEAAKRLGALGSTLVLDAPPPEISSPISAPIPQPPAQRPARDPLASTRVLGSSPVVTSAAEPARRPAKDPLARTAVYGSPVTAPRLPPVPPPAALSEKQAAPPAPVAPTPHPAPSDSFAQASAPRPRVVSVPEPSEAGTSVAGSLTRDPVRAPRRSPVLLAGVIAFVAGAALLAVAGVALWKIRQESAHAASTAPASISPEATVVPSAPPSATPPAASATESADAGSAAEDAGADATAD